MSFQTCLLKFLEQSFTYLPIITAAIIALILYFRKDSIKLYLFSYSIVQGILNLLNIYFCRVIHNNYPIYNLNIFISYIFTLYLTLKLYKNNKKAFVIATCIALVFLLANIILNKSIWMPTSLFIGFCTYSTIGLAGFCLFTHYKGDEKSAYLPITILLLLTSCNELINYILYNHYFQLILDNRYPKFSTLILTISNIFEYIWYGTFLTISLSKKYGKHIILD